MLSALGFGNDEKYIKLVKDQVLTSRYLTVRSRCDNCNILANEWLAERKSHETSRCNTNNISTDLSRANTKISSLTNELRKVQIDSDDTTKDFITSAYKRNMDKARETISALKIELENIKKCKFENEKLKELCMTLESNYVSHDFTHNVHSPSPLPLPLSSSTLALSNMSTQPSSETRNVTSYDVRRIVQEVMNEKNRASTMTQQMPDPLEHMFNCANPDNSRGNANANPNMKSGKKQGGKGKGKK
jgi:hypothetical protein